MLLAIDTSTRWIGLGLYDGAIMAGEMLWQTQNHHTIELAPSLNELFNRCGVSRKDLKALAIALGPGSFTSLRIGLAMAKGLAIGLGIPVVGVPTLDILAANLQPEAMPLLALLQAGRGRFGMARYVPKKGKWVNSTGVSVTTIEELISAIHQPTIVCGELSALDRQALRRADKSIVIPSPAQCMRRPAVLAEIAWSRWQKDRVDDLNKLNPIYLHTGAEIPA